MRTNWIGWALALAGAAGTAGVGLALAGVHSDVRTALVLLFLTVVPTVAVAGFLRGLDGLARIVIALTTNVAALALIAMLMLTEGVWSPTAGLVVVTVLSAACLAAQVPPLRRGVTAGAVSLRDATLARVALTNGHAVAVQNGSRESFLSRIGVRTVTSTDEERYPPLGNGVCPEAPLSSTATLPGGPGMRQRARAVGAVVNGDKVTEQRTGELYEFPSEASSWSPVHPARLGKIFRGEAQPTKPSVFLRDDGAPLLYPRRINLFTGEPETCKTWASLLAVVQEIHKGNVTCIVDFEDTAETTVDRLRQLGLTETQIAQGVVYCSPSSPFDEVAGAHLEAYFQHLCDDSGRELTLAVVDSVNEAMSVEGLDPDTGGDVARFCHGLPRWLKDRGAAVVLVEHVSRPSESRGRWAALGEQGISGVDGAAYSFKEMAPFGRGVTGKVRVAVSKDRGGFVRQHAPAKVMGTLTLVSSPHDGSIAASFTAPTGGRLTSRRVPAKSTV